MFHCVCIDDGENPQFSPTYETRKAAKEHTCCECHEPIKKGSLYEYVRGLWDGDWRTFKTCRVCAQIREDFMSCGYTYGDLWYHLRELMAEKNPETGRWETPAWLE